MTNLSFSLIVAMALINTGPVRQFLQLVDDADVVLEQYNPQLPMAIDVDGNDTVLSILLQLQWIGSILAYYNIGLPGADKFYVRLDEQPVGSCHVMQFTLRRRQQDNDTVVNHKVTLRTRVRVQLVCAHHSLVPINGVRPLSTDPSLESHVLNETVDSAITTRLTQFWYDALENIGERYMASQLTLCRHNLTTPRQLDSFLRDFWAVYRCFTRMVCADGLTSF